MAAKKTLRRSKWSTADQAVLWGMLAPFLILFVVFTVIPVLSSVGLSFFSYDMFNMPKFIGIKNYYRMVTGDNVFTISLKNTLVFSVITGPLGFFLSFVLAWMINELGRYSRALLSFVFYSPALIGNGYLIWQVMFSGDSYGYVNSMLLSMNLIHEPLQWFNDPKYSMTLIMIVQLWMSMGVAFLANIAGLQNINTEMFEAGAIDGVRNRWMELWYITLPAMKSILLFSAVMQIQATFSISAVAVTLTGNPSVNYSTHTLVTHLQDIAFVRFEMGYAGAISVFLFLLMAVTREVIGKLLGSTGK